MTKPKNGNPIALIWRDNVMKIMEHYQLSVKDMVNITDKSDGIIRANFAGNIMKGEPSLTTVTIIENKFRLSKGCLGKRSFKLSDEPDMVNPKSQPPPQQAMLMLPISASKLEMIMRIINSDEY